jgi:serine/threonine-protein kinase
MPAPTSPVELVDWLERNELLPPEQVRELRPLLPSFPDVRLLVKELIRRDWLTPYQVNQIMQGKGDQLLLGWFRLRERLGEGAMGQVFKAWNTRLQRVVAVKTLHKELIANARAMERFRQEIEAVGQLDHPNIVRVRDADEIDSRPFMVMDFIDGVNLSYLVKTQGPLPIHTAVECIRQAAIGLEHAYERGVVHRDVKPANLLIQSVVRSPWSVVKDKESDRSVSLTTGHGPRTADVFCIKILDFGLARFDSERRYSTRLTHPGCTLGTVDYMAPEQAESARNADTRADIFSLGCTLYFLLTGKPPFEGNSVAEKMAARISGTAPSVREARPEVPEALDRVLLRMLARQPADRYQTPAEAAAALEPFTVPIQRMEIPERIPIAPPITIPADAGPIPLAVPIDTPTPVVQSVPMSEVVQVAAASPGVPALYEAVVAEPTNPFSLSSAETVAAAVPTNGPPRPATVGRERTPAGSRLNPKVAIPVVAGGALLLVLFIGCSGYLLIDWMRGGRSARDRYPDGAALEINEALLSSEVLRPGQSKIVIVKIRRKEFDGPVSLVLKDPPPGVSTETDKKPVIIPAGRIAAEVRINADYGIGKAESNMRVVARAKNLSAERELHVQVVPAKNPLGK